MNRIEEIEKKHLEKLTTDKQITEFFPGDTIRVNVRIVEGKRQRVQAFEGVCIAKKSGGINSSFTVRKVSFGEGVERVFQLHSPNLDSIDLIRSGKVRRAKLYYLRERSGKSARINEKIKKKLGLDTAKDKVAKTTIEDQKSSSASESADKVQKSKSEEVQKEENTSNKSQEKK